MEAVVMIIMWHKLAAYLLDGDRLRRITERQDERQEMLRTNSGVLIDELTIAPFQIEPKKVRVEQGGNAVIIDIDTSEGNGPFFRFYSWDTEHDHAIIRAFIGRRVEVTIKVV
jgi:hypothetical protein